MAARRIDDFGGYAKDSDELMRRGSHIKRIESADGSGGINDYPDTNDKIVRDQREGDRQIRSKPMRDGDRY